jgi:hypothetical protein
MSELQVGELVIANDLGQVELAVPTEVHAVHAPENKDDKTCSEQLTLSMLMLKLQRPVFKRKASQLHFRNYKI